MSVDIDHTLVTGGWVIRESDMVSVISGTLRWFQYCLPLAGFLSLVYIQENEICSIPILLAWEFELAEKEPTRTRATGN